MGDFHWDWLFIGRQFTNWWFLGCGVCYIAACLLWMHMLKHFPFSVAYPVTSISYVFGMIAAFLFFHEQIPLTRWIGVMLIIGGCYFIVK